MSLPGMDRQHECVCVCARAHVCLYIYWRCLKIWSCFTYTITLSILCVVMASAASLSFDFDVSFDLTFSYPSAFFTISKIIVQSFPNLLVHSDRSQSLKTILPSQVTVIDTICLYIDWFGLVKDIIHVTNAPWPSHFLQGKWKRRTVLSRFSFPQAWFMKTINFHG